MVAFRLYLLFIFLVLTIYTLIVGANHGWNLLAVFVNDMMAMNWPGQFNLDFMGFLSLSALWVAWRHHFAPLGLALGVVAFFGGIVFLSIYLLYVTGQAKGDVNELFLGKTRASD